MAEVRQKILQTHPCIAKHFISVLRAGKTVTLYPALTWSPPPFKSGEKSHTFYPNHEWFAVNKVKKKKHFKLVIIKSKQTIDQSNSFFSSGTFEVHRSPLIIHYMVNIDD